VAPPHPQEEAQARLAARQFSRKIQGKYRAATRQLLGGY
jgi:hypothetical protein